MLVEDQVTSLKVPPASAAALLALAIVCWPTLTSAQTVRTPQISVDQAFSVAPIGTGAAAQQQTFLELTEWGNRVLKKVAELQNRGGSSGDRSVSNEPLFRVGMFVQYATMNMKRLMTLYQDKKTCGLEFQGLAPVAKAELEQLGAVFFGRMTDAVSDVKTRVMCP